MGRKSAVIMSLYRNDTIEFVTLAVESILNQSYTDETNSTKVIDPSRAYIIPTGSNEKPVKIAFEGSTLVDERSNDDWSKEIQVYKKLGVGTIITNNICVYRNTSLTK